MQHQIKHLIAQQQTHPRIAQQQTHPQITQQKTQLQTEFHNNPTWDKKKYQTLKTYRLLVSYRIKQVSQR